MGLLKEIAASVTWLSGSLCGLGVIVYACGYLLIRAHLHMLGIEPVYDYGNQRYIQEGAKFLFVLTDTVSRTLLSLGAVAAIAVATFLLLAAVAVAALRVSLGEAKWRPALLRRVARSRLIFRTNHRCLCYFLYACLLAILLSYSGRHLSDFQAPLSVTGLMFADHRATPPEDPRAAEIAALLVKGDQDRLFDGFFDLTLFAIISAVLLGAAAWITPRSGLRLLMLAPFALTFMMCLMLLPMAYGVLMLPARFPRVTASIETPMTADKASNLFLIAKTEQEFVLWDGANKRILWIPKERMKGLDIGEAEPLFAPARRH